jgi:hypothetical protein
MLPVKVLYHLNFLEVCLFQEIDRILCFTVRVKQMPNLHTSQKHPSLGTCKSKGQDLSAMIFHFPHTVKTDFYVKPCCSNKTRKMYSNSKALTVIHIYAPNRFCDSVYLLALIFIYCRQKLINCTISRSYIISSFIKYTPC